MIWQLYFSVEAWYYSIIILKWEKKILYFEGNHMQSVHRNIAGSLGFGWNIDSWVNTSSLICYEGKYMNKFWCDNLSPSKKKIIQGVVQVAEEKETEISSRPRNSAR